MKSVRTGPFYRLLRGASRRDPSGRLGRDRRVRLPATAGPWSAEAQHGGPPAALLARAVEAPPGGRRPGRRPLHHGAAGGRSRSPRCASRARCCDPALGAAWSRPSSSTSTRDRVVATAQAWLFPARRTARSDLRAARPTAPRTASSTSARRAGAAATSTRSTGAGSAAPWTRPAPAWSGCARPTWSTGEPISPVQRLLACVDSASGASALLDVREWAFLNTDLTVHVLRRPSASGSASTPTPPWGPARSASPPPTSTTSSGWSPLASALLVARRCTRARRLQPCQPRSGPSARQPRQPGLGNGRASSSS